MVELGGVWAVAVWSHVRSFDGFWSGLSGHDLSEYHLTSVCSAWCEAPECAGCPCDLLETSRSLSDERSP